MTSDLSPEGSPYRPHNATSWMKLLMESEDQRNLDIHAKVYVSKEEAMEVEWHMMRILSQVPPEDRVNVLAIRRVAEQEFPEAQELAQLEAELAALADEEEQFARVRLLSVEQKAALMVLAGQTIIEQRHATENA